MDFELTKVQKMLQKSVREFVKKEIAPIADDFDKKGPLSKEDAHRFINGLIPFGFVGTMVPEADGGPNNSRG
ncbi:acyl-CoA dehydrogenase family protein [bacterium]|nr:acyl-CoA dehydrogenase family protein [bacterium]